MSGTLLRVYSLKRGSVWIFFSLWENLVTRVNAEALTVWSALRLLLEMPQMEQVFFVQVKYLFDIPFWHFYYFNRQIQAQAVSPRGEKTI